METDSKGKKFQKQLYLRSSTELAPGLFPHPHPITCLQVRVKGRELSCRLVDGLINWMATAVSHDY